MNLKFLGTRLRPSEIKVIKKSLEDVAAIAFVGIPVLVFLKFLVPVSHIPSRSMEPSLNEGDRVLVNNLQFLFKTPQRGDIVAFDSGFRAGFLGKERVLFVKRVVGLPGDSIQIKDGYLLINGEVFPEPYVAGPQGDFPLTEVPPGDYFVLGDNRRESYDSRYLGTVSLGRIKGKVVIEIP